MADTSADITAYTQWFMNQLDSSVQIDPPSSFSAQVKVAKKILNNDTSGLVAPVIDFMIKSVLSSSIRIETDNDTATKTLNAWLDSINIGVAVDIPSGLRKFMEQYLLERWTSGLVVTQVNWNKFDTFVLPTSMAVLDGASIRVSGDETEMGNFAYSIKSDKSKKDIALSDIYVHKSGRSTDRYPTPYLVKRVYGNWMIKRYIKEHAADIAKHALFIQHMKKGHPNLPGVAYSPAQLNAFMKEVKDQINKSKNEGGFPTMATMFDTETNVIMPDLVKIMGVDVYQQLDMDIRSGLGLVEVIKTSGRNEAILNPKPLIEEVYDALADVKQLIKDILKDIYIKNNKHNKLFSQTNQLRIVTGPIKTFWDNEFLTLLKDAHDRGAVSKRDYIESLGLDFSTVIKRREEEMKEGYEILLYPPVTVNSENITGKAEEERIGQPIAEPTDDENDETDTPPAKNKQTKDNTPTEPPISPNNKNDQFSSIDFSEYKTINELPARIATKLADAELKKAFMGGFNWAYEHYKDSPEAIRESMGAKYGWGSVKKIGFKGKDNKWHLKAKYQKPQENK
jgi:cation transport regulator ChaB